MREFDQLKTVPELYDMEIRQKKNPCPIIKNEDNGEENYKSETSRNFDTKKE